MEILRCEALSKVYRSGESKVIALDQVSLSLAQGSFTAITAGRESPRCCTCSPAWITPAAAG